MLSREQIERFFNHECSAEEANAIARFFEENPEELGKYISEAEWEAFQYTEKLDPEKSDKFWMAINRETLKTSSVSKIFYLKRFAAAAAVIALIISGWLFYNRQDQSEPTKAIAIEKKIENTTGRPMAIKLSDSSEVLLSAYSSLAYYEPFEEDKRSLHLEGEAKFNVTKDSIRPFIVYSGAIATRVLGTRFSVRSFRGEENIRVELFEGKVRVHAADSLNSNFKKAIDLRPGDVLLYNRDNKSATVSSANTSVTKQGDSKTSIKTTAGKSALAGNAWYMFNNQSLSGVFDQLEILYDQKITYSREDVAGMTFIGKLDKTDKLESVLEAIAQLNNLKVSKTATGFHISKQP